MWRWKCQSCCVGCVHEGEGQHLLGAKGLLAVPKKGQAEGEALDGLLPLKPAAGAFFGVGLRLEPVSDLLNALQAAQSASARLYKHAWACSACLYLGRPDDLCLTLACGLSTCADV